MRYIDAEKLKDEIKHLKIDVYDEAHQFDLGARSSLTYLESFIDSLPQETPDTETILRICKLHKAWFIMAPWENVEDFVTTNWNSENIV